MDKLILTLRRLGQVDAGADHPQQHVRTKDEDKEYSQNITCVSVPDRG